MKNIATIALIAASAAFAGCASPQSTATTKEGNADTKAVAKAGTPSEAKTDAKTVPMAALQPRSHGLQTTPPNSRLVRKS